MKQLSGRRQVLIILIVFLITRIGTFLLGFKLDYTALYAYWQYLDVETLKNNLLRGVWYDHTQPPLFNLFLGVVIKLGGDYSRYLFYLIFKVITLANTLLLFSILRKLIPKGYIPLVIALFYLLSPASLIFECELFYTTIVSLFLLISVYFIIRFHKSENWPDIIGFFSSLVLLCLTRSVFHLLWIAGLTIIFAFYYRKKVQFQKVVVIGIAGIFVTGIWYVKNKIIFEKFTTSTWLGMNMARNVFHDNEIRDSSLVEAYEPFSKISVYKKFLNPQFENRFSGLNDRDLLMEMKNDTFINEKQVNYIAVSELYQKASLNYVAKHPGSYLKNVVQSFILYFSPATIYSFAIKQSAKIKYYDLVYSFNLTHFSDSKQSRRILLTISGIPKMIFYLFIIFWIGRYSFKNKKTEPWNLFILCTITYVLCISSFFEHYENMRFRFESEPLFLILVAQFFHFFYSKMKSEKTNREMDI